MFVCIFLLFGLSVPVCSPGPIQYIFHTPMTQYSLFVLKVLLNTNKTNKQTMAISLAIIHVINIIIMNVGFPCLTFLVFVKLLL